MKEMLTHHLSAVKTFRNLNHLFQPADTGAPDAYAWIDTTFDESAMAYVTQWLNSIAQ